MSKGLVFSIFLGYLQGFDAEYIMSPIDTYMSALNVTQNKTWHTVIRYNIISCMDRDMVKYNRISVGRHVYDCLGLNHTDYMDVSCI